MEHHRERRREVTQLDAFERIVALLNEAMLDDARWPEASRLIDEACGTKGSTLTFGADGPANNVQIFFAKSYARGEDRAEQAREYFRRYYPTDEHLPRVRQLPDSKIVRVVDLFSESELRSSLAYNEGYPRFDIQNGLSVRLDGPHGSRIVWSIQDPVDADGWTSSRTQMIARVLPHLRQYVRVQSALEEAEAFGASVIELLDHPQVGVIQLDQRGLIMATNDSAREVLRGSDGLSDDEGELCAAWPADHARLQALLARALPRLGEQGVSGSMTVRRRSLPGFGLHVKPLGARGLDDRTGRAGALVLIVDPTQRVRIRPALVEAALGLTPTEAAIATQLAEGRTLRQIAAATGREYTTVRTHLMHIFGKLGCSRQFDVVQAVQALSRVPASRD